jgi:hypothetical protein
MLATLAALSLASCGADENGGGDQAADQSAETETSGAKEDQSKDERRARYSEDDPEYLLAVIDADSSGDRVPDDEVDRYAKRLDKLERYCHEERSMLADQVVNGVKILKDEKQLDYSNYEMLEAYGNALTSKLGTDQKCSEAFAGVLAITTAEEG